MRWALFVLVTACAAPKVPTRIDDPIARLAPVWHESSVRRIDHVANGRLFALRQEAPDADQTSVAMFDLRRGYAGTLVALDTAPIAVTANTDRVLVIADSILVGYPSPRANDEPLQELWRYDDGTVEQIAASDRLVLATRNDAVQMIVGIDPADGVERWQTQLPDDWETSHLSAEGAHGLVVGRVAEEVDEMGNTIGGPVVAIGIDLATGRKLWEYRGSEATTVASDARRLVMVQSDVATIVDRATGHATDVDLPEALAPSVKLAGDTAYLAGPSKADSDVGFVMALDLRTRRVRVLDRAPVMVSTAIAINSVAVFVQSPGGTVRAVDRLTGAHRWEWNTGGRAHIAVDRDQLVIFESNILTVFAPSEKPPAVEVAVIRGRLRSSCAGGEDEGEGEGTSFDVRIGDLVTRTDPDGRFQAVISGRGRIGIGAVETSSSPQAAVELSGRGRYRPPPVDVFDCEGPGERGEP